MMQKKRVILGLCIAAVLLWILPGTLAHDEVSAKTQFLNNPWVYTAPLWITVLGAVLEHYYVTSGKNKKTIQAAKKIFFIIIVVVTAFVSLAIFYTSIQSNIQSWSKGPVHWHADFEIWNCNKKLDMVDPQGFSNKVGTPVFHEHNDDRIHIEGDVMHQEDISLTNFFSVIGGKLDATSLVYPTIHGSVEMREGMRCNGKPAKLQIFVYTITNPDFTKKWTMTQEKMQDPAAYLLSPYSQVPAGDCIIVELSEEKAKTEHMCESYRIAMNKGELQWQ